MVSRTTLELEGDKKVVFIDHRVHGQHRFTLPTKEEIFQEKIWINSFMIFRTIYKGLKI